MCIRDRNTISHTYKDPLIAQLENFRDVINSQSEPLVSALEGAKSLQVIEAINESIAKKSNIELNNIWYFLKNIASLIKSVIIILVI